MYITSSFYLLLQILSKNFLKANHNITINIFLYQSAVANIVKELFESKSQQSEVWRDTLAAVANIVKELFESKSQLQPIYL